MPLTTPLARLLADHIREAGPIPFREFMDWALYHPELGYYNRSGVSLGKTGDFYTSPHVSPIFGWTVGRAVEKLLAEAEDEEHPRHPSRRARPPACVIEFGAGRGFLAKDVLESFQHRRPGFWDRLQYVLVEQSPALRKFQEGILLADPEVHRRVCWSSSEELGTSEGIVLANEFVDALPFHRVELTNDGFKEIFVDVAEESFVERLLPLSSERLAEGVERTARDYEDGAGSPWSVGMQMEVSLESGDWILSLKQWLKRGWVLIIDYGDEAGKLYGPHQRHGTVKSFFHHQLSEQLYDHIGEQDITADVNFSLLKQIAAAEGFSPVQFWTQADFLEENELLGMVEERARALRLNPEEARGARRQILNLILPETMGTRFKVLLLRCSGSDSF